VARAVILARRVDDFQSLALPRKRLGFTAQEWARLSGLYAAVALLHVCGWGLFLYHSARNPSLLGLGFVAYMFGLRHAFDADHIAAVDDTVRFLLQKGRRQLGVGFYFSLGHATVVLLLVAGIILAAALVRRELPNWQAAGALIGAGVSGAFLCFIGILNLLVLLELVKIWRGTRLPRHTHTHLEGVLARRGFLNRLFGQRFQHVIKHSWQMYPLGLLFGLGFDTASEVGLLAMTAGATAGNLPIGAVLSLPILFAAGMTVMDTTDGILMTKACDWAYVNPMRKLVYNLLITGLSVAIAMLIGALELAQMAIRLLRLHGPLFEFVGAVNFGSLGLWVTGLYLFAWCVSIAARKCAQRVAPSQ
jgi:nickel/cobalt transporter (NiCoT) family protein